MSLKVFCGECLGRHKQALSQTTVIMETFHLLPGLEMLCYPPREVGVGSQRQGGLGLQPQLRYENVNG